MRENIPFPRGYKSDLQRGVKTMTLRVAEEQGKYLPGKTYKATSYGGDDLGVFVHVVEIQTIEVTDFPLDKERKGDKGIRYSGTMDVVWFESRRLAGIMFKGSK